MAQTAIRDYLKSRGLNDNEITYDNGTVLAKGKRFMDATPQADGRTYADTQQLENAFNDYDMRDQLAQLKTKLATPNTEMTALQQQLKDRINKPVQQFSYNQNTDPAYQAALQSARQNTQTAAGNIAADMNKRGLLNSTITQDRGNQAAAQEYNRVSNEVLPQLMNQAYQRYLGQQQLENQQISNLFNLANMYDSQDRQAYDRLAQVLGIQNNYNQQQFGNERALASEGMQRQQANLGAAATVGQQLGRVLNPKDDWSNLYNQDDAPLNMQAQQQQYGQQQDRIQNEAQYLGVYQGQPTMQRIMQEANIRNMTADNARAAASEARAAGNQQLGALFDVWDRTGEAPAGIPGVPAGTRLAGKQPAPKSTDYKSNPDFASDVAYLKSNPSAAQQLDTNPEAFINEYGYDGYLALRKAAGIDKDN